MILWYSVDTVRRLRWRAASRHLSTDAAIKAAVRRSAAEGYAVVYAVPGGCVVAEFRNGLSVSAAAEVTG